ncbi:MAG TPA: GAF domain-containing SpoIIE family protein phosphatase [Pseudonocardiaceae bacterium]|nr:GAF domain-containing SpoIIE family protein phosphatase [Pseudonocardiaceae bacterium]
MGSQDDAEGRLRRIEAVTDTGLAQLDTEKLLSELLERVRELLHADTATVLLVDAAGRHLLATAAVGIEEEVRQGVRVPVGSGFAGGIAASRQPTVIDHVDESTVVNPLLWERGLHGLAGAPMIANGRLIGVLHVGTVTPQQFTGDDLHLLQLVADRIALATYNQVSAVERAAVEALQYSLVPTVLPEVSGLTVASRYVPGADTGVGGDWYDVFPLPGDRVGIVMGDVVGHGLTAAVVMGRLRSALRAYALEFADPGTVLDRLDRKAQHFEHGTMMATVSYAVVDATREQVTVALAGHLPPMLAVPGQKTVLSELPVCTPIGFPSNGQPCPSTVLDLPPGGVLCFYTDGLVERSDSTIDVGLERLRRIVTPEPPEAVCVRVMTTLVGIERARDDIALLVLRREPGQD